MTDDNFTIALGGIRVSISRNWVRTDPWAAREVERILSVGLRRSLTEDERILISLEVAAA